MNWHEKRKSQLTSDQGYEVSTTAIQCKVRWLAKAPSKQLLAVLGSKENAIDHCEQHYMERDTKTAERMNHE